MPLEGVRIVDLSRILAGPFATMMLADMGADVIKVEQPERGDDSRGWGPPFVDGTSTYFLSVNRNKRGITLDLKNPRGKQLLWNLIDRADVVVSNFRVGVMESLGFAYADVVRRNPGCVYAVINGYGSSGPRSGDPSFDLLIQADSGLMHLTGSDEGPPMKVGVSIADLVAGFYLVQGILLALLEKRREGIGQRVEVALHDAMVSVLTFQAQQYLSSGRQPARMGNRHPSIVPYETFVAADGTLVLAVANEAIWRRLCGALGRDDLWERPEFEDNAARVANRDALVAELGSQIAAHDVAYWEDKLGSAGVPCGRVRTVHEVLECERRTEDGMVVSFPGSEEETLGIPVKMSATPGKIRHRAPRLGEHTDEVLSSLGISRSQIDAWRAAGIL